jgi:hypothetical protein
LVVCVVSKSRGCYEDILCCGLRVVINSSSQ